MTGKRLPSKGSERSLLPLSLTSLLYLLPHICQGLELRRKLQGWAEGYIKKFCEESPDFWVLYQACAELRTIQLIQLFCSVPAGKLRPTSQQSGKQD